MKATLLEQLCCPETHQDLAFADAATLERLNNAIAAGTLKNRAGNPVTEKLEGGLVRQDNQVLYPVRREIPVMLIDESIPLAN